MAALLCLGLFLALGMLISHADNSCVDHPTPVRWCPTNAQGNDIHAKVVLTNFVISPAAPAGAPYDCIVCVGDMITATVQNHLVPTTIFSATAHDCPNYWRDNEQNNPDWPFNITNEWSYLNYSTYDMIYSYGNSVSFSYTNGCLGGVGVYGFKAEATCGVDLLGSAGGSFAFVDVASLAPQGVTEIDDADNNPNTRAFAVCSEVGRTVDVFASSSPVIEATYLPSCWVLSGGQGISIVNKTLARVSVNTVGEYPVTCKAGGAPKITTILGSRVQPKVASIPGAAFRANQYNYYPTQGCADNLLGLWPGDILEVKLKIEPQVIASHLPNNFIVWNVPEFNVPNNSTIWQFQWGQPGQITIRIEYGIGSSSTIEIDQPDVGSISDVVSAAIDFVRAPFILIYANMATQWAAELQAGGMDDTHANACQHAYWNALMASDPFIGANIGLWHTTAYEYSDKHSGIGLATDTVMDLHNNYKGSTVVYTLNGVPNPVPIKADILTKLQDGELWILTPDNFVRRSNGQNINFPPSCCGN